MMSFTGYELSNEIRDSVAKFYQDDEISMMMPGMKDFVSVRNENGEKKKIQKRLVLGNLKEIFQQYKDRFPNYRIGFSTFAMLRPQQCVLAGGSGTHTNCVCSCCGFEGNRN